MICFNLFYYSVFGSFTFVNNKLIRNEQTKIKIEQKGTLPMTDGNYYRTTLNVMEVICMRKK